MTALLVALSLLTGCRPGVESNRSAPPAPPVGGGCTLAPTGGLVRQTMTAPGPGGPSTTRTYELYVPRGVSATSSAPLLVSLHGLGANGSIQGAVTHWSAFDDAQAAAGSPFLLAFPDGVSSLWFWGLDSSYDVAFLFDLAARLETTGCVDRSRVFVDGWSEGAYMAQRVACAAGDPAVDRHGVALAGVHSYAGGDPGVVRGSCRPSVATPVLLSQGLDDGLVKPQQMGFAAFQAWAPRYACGPASAPYTAAQHLDGCRGGAAVAWWPIAGFGHLDWSCAADPLWHNRGAWAFLTSHMAPTATTCS